MLAEPFYDAESAGFSAVVAFSEALEFCVPVEVVEGHGPPGGFLGGHGGVIWYCLGILIVLVLVIMVWRVSVWIGLVHVDTF